MVAVFMVGSSNKQTKTDALLARRVRIFQYYSTFKYGGVWNSEFEKHKDLNDIYWRQLTNKDFFLFNFFSP